MSGRTRLAAQAALASLAAASALSAVFASSRWLMPVAGAILLVAATNELARRTRAAAALGPVVSAGVVLLYVTALDARDFAYGGVIPTGASLQVLADLVRSGFTDIRSLSTPVPAHTGLVLLAVIGLAAVELVVDLLAVTLRRAALAGLPLLAVFTLCTSVARHGVGWMPFVVATAGYLWLLLTDAKDRVTRWGRPLGAGTPAEVAAEAAAPGRPRLSWADADAAPSPLSALARRVGVTAIAVGVVVPLLIPGLRGGIPKGGGNGLGSGSGSSKVVTVNPIVTMRADLVSPKATPVLRMTSSDPSPVYLRLTALDRFDGTTFSPSDLSAPSGSQVHGSIDAPPVSGTGVRTTVSVDNLDVHWLPVPTQAEVVDVSGDWHYDPASNTIFSARSTTRHLSYTVASIRNEPTAAELNATTTPSAASFPTTLSLPRLPGDVVALAHSITATATTPFQRAVDIQNFLTSPPFTYSTSVAASDSADALEQFLFTTRRGFCQQYATAMAVLARVVGIPSRVAVGFTHGVKQNGEWLVTTHDAHAWPELYFPGYGWLPFEPTPRADGQAIIPAFAQPATNDGQPSDVPSKTQPSPAAPTDGLSPTLKRLLEADGAITLPPPAQTPSSSGSSLGWWIALAVLGGLLPLPGVARLAARRRRRRQPGDGAARAHAAWAELRAVAIDAGASWSDAVTPRSNARLIAAETPLDPGAQAALARLVSAEERARYAAVPGAEDPAPLWQAVTTVRHALFAERGRWPRVAAAVVPRSTLRAVQAAATRIADLLDLVDASGARMRRWVRRTPRTA